ncbi:MAG: NAD-dependent protein deacylase [Clostridia bacterium]|nr:NAD-dependent protein deacylase [Clostridia bacterium]
MDSKIEKLNEMIKSNSRIVFFGGAGVSTESGIPDFRSADGIYMMNYKYPPEEIISRSFFDAHPKEFFEFYKKYFYYPDAKPNIAHIKLAELEKAGKLSAVVTQNIDGLHTAAGSKKVYELHGSVLRNYCMRCGKSYDIDFIVGSDGIPTCDCGGTVKPDVVLYEESLDENVITGAVNAISNADMLIVAGTSLRVYPAAGFIKYFKGDNLVLINRDSTPMDDMFGLVIKGSLGDVMKQISV